MLRHSLFLSVCLSVCLSFARCVCVWHALAVSLSLWESFPVFFLSVWVCLSLTHSLTLCGSTRYSADRSTLLLFRRCGGASAGDASTDGRRRGPAVVSAASWWWRVVLCGWC
eukprot:COSAG02_NODE_254_length_26937_cov_16.503950_4_plen_112_part_00